MINFKPFLVIYCILKENKTHYKVSHFLPVDPNPSPPPIAAYLPMCGGNSFLSTALQNVDEKFLKPMYVIVQFHQVRFHNNSWRPKNTDECN